MSPGFVALVFLFVVVVAGVTVYQYWRNQQRIQQLHKDYNGRGVALVAINPDGPKSIGSTDLACRGQTGRCCPR